MAAWSERVCVGEVDGESVEAGNETVGVWERVGVNEGLLVQVRLRVQLVEEVVGGLH